MLIAPPDTGPYAFAEGMTDAALLEQSLEVPERFAAVFDRHNDEIYRYAVRRLGPETAEDVVAETFLTAFRKRGTYDPERPDARPWLYGIATHAIREHRRAEIRRNRTLARGEAHSSAESFAERSDSKVTAERLQPRLAAVLARLSAADRDLLLLIAWADLTYEEAAQALGVPVGTVRSRLHRIRKKVRRALGGTDPMATNEESWA
ncbi:RNA polymerase sigma factor [Planotetraspora phitsanulokensis]|uniref:DNA-directed RNA polymerase sigma-70 factor n=1 Tax=Planotetraspora phitsanulokensis TaxID=575192 RepID=A0A8J3UD16_9ACTN|nr:RNA polymerase sigma factor [Planotetraspora phitsanulokensis]GII41086.1 DNA-directed RNA polymerase sigma-70 factor [Planotetraspora phitsanulokensis]